MIRIPNYIFLKTQCTDNCNKILIHDYNSPYKGIGENIKREAIAPKAETNAWYDDAADAIGEKFNNNIDDFLSSFEQEYIQTDKSTKTFDDDG